MGDAAAAAVIPARYGSTRLPAKVLADLGGRPMVVRVWENCRDAGVFEKVIIATDHAAVVEAARAHGAEAVLTDPAHASGTERVAEVAAGLDLPIVVNVQGDEPFVGAETLVPLVEAARRPGVEVATPVTPVTSGLEMADPSVVKVVVDGRWRALYFSRWPIPFHREAWGGQDPWLAVAAGGTGAGPWWRHLGLYAFRRERLIDLVRLSPSPAEQMEKLEQLRWLHHGVPVTCVAVKAAGLSIDTPEDLEQARRRLARKG